MNPMSLREFLLDAARIVGDDFVLTSPSQMIPYSHDASPAEPSMPSAVLLPGSAEEVSEIVKLANRYRVPLVPSGARTSLHGGPIPYGGAVVIDLMRMNRIMRVSIEDGYVETEAGVRLDELNAELSRHGYFFPPDPASAIAATVGGSIANGAGGMRAARYGTVKDWVLGLEVVLPTGDLVFVGCRTLKCRQGYGLTSLFVGSEGTLGIITSAVLKIWPLPENVARLRVFFKSPEDAIASVIRLRSRGFRPLILEFLDRATMDAVHSYISEFQYPEDAGAMLLIDIEGPKEAMGRLIDSVRNTLGDYISLEYAEDPEDMDRLYTARRAAYPALLRYRPNTVVYPEDFSVPPSRLIEAYRGYMEICRKYGLHCPTWGHVGDGNLHPNILIERGNEEARKAAFRAIYEMGLITIRLGGTVSSEHGIGIMKKELLVEELRWLGSEKLIEVMRNIKRILDPNGILNPGKIVD